MKKLSKVLALTIVIAMVFTIAACGGGNAGNAAPSSPAPAAPAPAPSGGDATDDTVYDLVFTSHDSPSTAFARAIDEWVDELNTESNGRLNIEEYYGGTLAAAPDAVGVVAQGGADICWNTVSLNPNQFKYIDIFAACGEKLTNSELASYVVMRLIQESDVISNEYNAPGLRCVGVHTLGPTIFAGKGEKITSLDQVKGMSIQSLGKNAINILNELGAATIGVTPADLYENYAKNVCTASLLEGSLNDSAKLYELIDYICSFNYNTSTAFLVMNQQKFDSLPPDLQELIDSKYESFSAAAGKYVNDTFREFIKTKIPENNIELYDAPQAMVDQSNDLFKVVVEEPWRENCRAGGVDADALLALIYQLIDEGRAKYGPEKDWFK